MEFTVSCPYVGSHVDPFQATLQTFAVASITPFMALVDNAAAVMEMPRLAWLYTISGVADT